MLNGTLKVLRKFLQLMAALILFYPIGSQAQMNATRSNSFNHAQWDELLGLYVVPINEGKSSVVDYQGLNSQRNQLSSYLESIAAISEQEFDRWTDDDQLAFLINAYNAWTVEFILTAWPDIASIKELGSFFSSPWEKEFVELFGRLLSLDEIEHELIRGSGNYNDPRIHFAVNCASIGCPALRAEAYDGDLLDYQLEQQASLFLMDRSRNRVENNSIQLSPIFKWYREDFEKGWLGINRLEDFVILHARDLGLNNSVMNGLRNRSVKFKFLKYDWRLNKLQQ